MRELRELKAMNEKNKPSPVSKKVNMLLDEFDEEAINQKKLIPDSMPIYSEAMVEWRDDTEPRPRTSRSSSFSSRYVFALNSIADDVSRQ